VGISWDRDSREHRNNTSTDTHTSEQSLPIAARVQSFSVLIVGKVAKKTQEISSSVEYYQEDEIKLEKQKQKKKQKKSRIQSVRNLSYFRDSPQKSGTNRSPIHKPLLCLTKLSQQRTTHARNVGDVPTINQKFENMQK
jgi:hypothetical protein